MPAYPCPKGHDSNDADFCSVCGAKIQPVAAESALCPDCGAKREQGAGMFCEICGFNFATGAHGELKPVLVPAGPPVPSPPVTVPPTPASQNHRWQLTITVDPSLRDAESPEPPAAFEPLTIPLDHEVTLIGRRSERRAIDPEIVIDQDDAVSHRHALLTRLFDGTLSLRDLESVNGTMLNGAVLTPLTDTPVKDGDVFTLGHWTRIAIKAAP